MVQSQAQEKVSQLNVKENEIKRKSTTPREEKLRASAPAWKKWFAAVLSLQILMIVGVAYSALLAGKNTDRYISMNKNQTDIITKQSSQINSLVSSATTLKAEVEDLRHFVSSKSSVNEIYLKIMILNPGIDPALSTKIAQLVHKYSMIYGRDPDLILSIISTESSFNPEAVSSVGAQGLMQIMPQWKKVLGIKNDLNDPETNINYGLQIFGFYKEMYKETDMALTAYNRGPGPVDMALMRGDNPKNNYAPTVLKIFDRLKALNVSSERN